MEHLTKLHQNQKRAQTNAAPFNGGASAPGAPSIAAGQQGLRRNWFLKESHSANLKLTMWNLSSNMLFLHNTLSISSLSNIIHNFILLYSFDFYVYIHIKIVVVVLFPFSFLSSSIHTHGLFVYLWNNCDNIIMYPIHILIGNYLHNIWRINYFAYIYFLWLLA
jgi:hypothetical protein